MLMKYSKESPSVPVPPTYLSVEITPSPVNVEEALIVGGLIACGSKSTICLNLWFRGKDFTHVSNELGSKVSLNRAADKIDTFFP